MGRHQNGVRCRVTHLVRRMEAMGLYPVDAVFSSILSDGDLPLLIEDAVHRPSRHAKARVERRPFVPMWTKLVLERLASCSERSRVVLLLRAGVRSGEVRRAILGLYGLASDELDQVAVLRSGQQASVVDDLIRLGADDGR